MIKSEVVVYTRVQWKNYDAGKRILGQKVNSDEWNDEETRKSKSVDSEETTWTSATQFYKWKSVRISLKDWDK